MAVALRLGLISEHCLMRGRTNLPWVEGRRLASSSCCWLLTSQQPSGGPGHQQVFCSCPWPCLTARPKLVSIPAPRPGVSVGALCCTASLVRCTWPFPLYIAQGRDECQCFITRQIYSQPSPYLWPALYLAQASVTVCCTRARRGLWLLPIHTGWGRLRDCRSCTRCCPCACMKSD